MYDEEELKEIGDLTENQKAGAEEKEDKDDKKG